MRQILEMFLDTYKGAKRILHLRGAWMRLFAFRCVSDAFIYVLISACTSLCLHEIKYECEGKF